MKTPITTQQAMSHPTVVATINVLSEMTQRLQDESDALKALVAEEREASAKLVDHILKEGGGTWGDAIRAKGNT